MKNLGIAILAVAFLGGAFFAVQKPDYKGSKNTEEVWRNSVDWKWYGLCLGMGTVGLVSVLLFRRLDARRSEKTQINVVSLEAYLQGLVKKLQDMNAQKSPLRTYEVRDWIDESLAEDLAGFVEIRESMIPLFGLQRYANVMDSFAGSERNINRAWSASADGYCDEVWICLSEAERLMSRAWALLRDYQRESRSPSL